MALPRKPSIARRKPNKTGDSGELGLVRSLRTRASQLQAAIDVHGSKGIIKLGIGDDCAVLRPRGSEDLVVTTDFSLEGVHFRRDWHTPQSAGHRCLARGLSDLAAMGARPEAAFLSLALPSTLTGAWRLEFLEGLMALAERHRVPLAGGDTAESPGRGGGLVCADIVLVGSVPRGKALLRSGARAGDLIYVTGALGGSSAELAAIRQRPSRFRRVGQEGHPHLFPEPRVRVGRKLMLGGLATAAIDLSDGLSTDLAHLCDESGLGAEVDVAALPVDARADLEQALHGGEDYELLFTVSRRAKVPGTLAGVLLHCIGRMTERGRRAPVVLIEGSRRRELVSSGWEHFR